MNKREVGMNIKQARKNKKLKQKELAEKIGFSESSISKYEQGLIKIPRTVIERIAKVLEVPLSDLISFDEEFNHKGELAEDAKKFEAFIDYLRSLDYSVLLHQVSENSYSAEIQGNGYISEFSQKEFEELQSNNRDYIEGAILLKSQKNKKS